MTRELDDEDAFEDDYTLRSATPGQEDWTWPDVPDDIDYHHVWTVVEGDSGDLYVSPGFHVVNRLSYVVTEQPWVTGDEEYLWHHFENDDEYEEEEP